MNKIAEREVDFLTTLYDFWKVGTPYKSSAKELAATLAVPLSTVSTIVTRLSRLGLIKREYKVTRQVGREAFYILTLSKEEALNKLKVSATSDSLKQRALNAIQENGEFTDALSLMRYIALPGENIDLHNLTHVLESLRVQGVVTFKRRGKQNSSSVPTRIKARVNGTQPESNPSTQPEPNPASIVETTEQISDNYPLIKALVNRRNSLEQAAKLAEEAGCDTIAIELLEAANKPLAPFEEEVVRLYNSCKG